MPRTAIVRQVTDRMPERWHPTDTDRRENEAMRRLLEVDIDQTVTEDVTPGREEFDSSPTPDMDPDE